MPGQQGLQVTDNFSMDRRQFLRLGSLGLAGALVGGSAVPGFAQQIVGQSGPATPLTPEPIRIELYAKSKSASVLPGNQTSVLSYDGSLLAGPPRALTPGPSYLGPTMRFNTGEHVQIRVYNQLLTEHVTHWHGLDVPAEADGHPRLAVMPGQNYLVDFSVENRAGTYWYHPHPDMRTARQVANGLAGFIIVHDGEERALNLPRGEYDVPLVLQDRQIDAENQFVYDDPMMYMPAGYLGDRILVNGQANFTLDAATRVYRLRLLNGSNARVYKLQWSDGTPMVAIGNDGGLIDVPRTYPYIMLSPGERIELWADFRNKPVGSQVTLRSLAFSGAGPAGSSTLPQAAAFDVMTVAINRAIPESAKLPDKLSDIAPLRLQDAVNAGNAKVIPLNTTGNPPVFTLNNAPFELEAVAANEEIKAGSLELWSFVNNTGLVHPIHFHGRQFQIVDRTVTVARRTQWLTVSSGYCDYGWKDTFTIMPGETVRVLIRFSKYPGLFLYHCHNLEHEDAGMMRNYRLSL